MDSQSFDGALLELAPQLPRYFARRVCNPATVEDLTQETLVKAFQAREGLRDAGRLRAWIYGIAYRTLVDHYRGNRLCSESRDELQEEHPMELSDVRTVLVASARCYLETLPGAYRDAVHLAEYEGLAHRDVARELGLSLTAAKARIRRGKIMVRELMEARCEFEYDGRGNIISYQVRPGPCVLARCR
jgi:RNA polymerase sigma-70 factor (ECF subfamily)